MRAALRCIAVICCRIIDIIQRAAAARRRRSRVCLRLLKLFWESIAGEAEEGVPIRGGGFSWLQLQLQAHNAPAGVVLALFTQTAAGPVWNIDLLTASSLKECRKVEVALKAQSTVGGLFVASEPTVTQTSLSVWRPELRGRLLTCYSLSEGDAA